MGSWWGSRKNGTAVEAQAEVESLAAKRERLGEKIAVMKTELDAFVEAIKQKQVECLANESFEARDLAFAELKKLCADRDRLDAEFQETLKEWAALPRG